MAKQTELGHVLPDRPIGQVGWAAFSLPLFRLYPSKEFGLLVFKEIRTSILMASISIHPSDQTKMATNTHNESSLESDPTDERRTAGRGDGGGQSEIDRPK